MTAERSVESKAEPSRGAGRQVGESTLGSLGEQELGAPALLQRAVHAPRLQPRTVRYLQRSVGNQAVLRLIQRAPATEDEERLEPLFGASGGATPARAPGEGVPTPATTDSRKYATRFDDLANPKDKRSGELLSQDGMLSEVKVRQQQEADKKNALPGDDKLAIDPAAARADLQQLYARLAALPALNSPQLRALFAQYVELAIARNFPAATQTLEAVLATLKAKKAFSIGHARYIRADVQASEERRAEESDWAMQRSMLWSKLEKWKAIDEVAWGEKGISLEASAAGKLFDGLEFGMKYWTNAILQKQWAEVSHNYVAQTQGVVHAQVLEGVHPESVLTTTEWPIISQRLRSGEVVALVVHIFNHTKDGGFEEVGQTTITQPDQWMSLPSVLSWDKASGTYSDKAVDEYHADQGEQSVKTSWKERQTETYKAETERGKGLLEERNRADAAAKVNADDLRRARFLEARARFVALTEASGG